MDEWEGGQSRGQPSSTSVDASSVERRDLLGEWVSPRMTSEMMAL